MFVADPAPLTENSDEEGKGNRLSVWPLFAPPLADFFLRGGVAEIIFPTPGGSE